jgi:hypothetical protein
MDVVLTQKFAQGPVVLERNDHALGGAGCLAAGFAGAPAGSDVRTTIP